MNPPLNQIINIVKKASFFKDTRSLILSDKKKIAVKHLSGSLKGFFTSALWSEGNENFLIISKDKSSVNNWFNDISLNVDPHHIATFIPPAKKQSDIAGEDESNFWMIEGLNILQKYSKTISLATAEIFTIDFPVPEKISGNRVVLTKGMALIREDFIKELYLNGFERQDFVSKQGEIAVRGGLVDIFPVGMDNPLRIEFWGDEIDSLREFNLLSQRSIREHESIEIIASLLSSDEEKSFAKISDYLPDNTLLIIDEPEIIYSADGMLQCPVHFRKIEMNGFNEPDVLIKSSPQISFHSSVRNFCDEARRIAAYKSHIFIGADSKIHLRRMQEIVENTLEFSDQENINFDGADKQTTLSAMSWFEPSPSEGFILNDRSLAVFTEHQVFDRLRVQEKRGKKYSGGFTLKELKQLHVGDYVVHADKGIALFDGFEKTTMGGTEQDCVRLIFADKDKLFVSLNYIHKIQKYSSQEGVVPKLSKLGSSEWIRKKERTKKKLKDIARELIKLYAQRKMKPGFPFPADTVWQKEFEASFIYEDTVDQARATSEVKKDMENETPMDRLVCGDVGFGKTEVAIRAAFKAVQSGKQVAVLVPTTILAQQHYMTFSDRLQNYPVIVDTISRFRTPAEQKEITARVKDGKIDVLIGTHRILSKDIVFKDLGMLVVDEEHRFGVGAKEKLRELRATIDTLTLTATPIPRTLNFSLMGARDLSVIETPPRNRLPVITEILEWDNEMITKAIGYELNRKGQVFFVTDKIEDIDIICSNLQMLMPTYRFAVAHGQMVTSQLESVMEKFIKGKIDVLITTKIVESGLDIPNANTMLINRANKFGLAELYQLRGRVGRSNNQAYCYLLIPPAKLLSAISLKRLQAIEEFTDLGSGFQLAMRDMEIRGAGNLLGPEQSGFIADIGFELYHRILDEAVAELRLEEFGDLYKDKPEYRKAFLENSDLAIVMNTEALLPSDYIRTDTERFTYYKKLYNVKSNDELLAIRDDLNDRFGKLPKQAEELIFAVRLRIAALNTGFVKISLLNKKAVIELPPESNKEFYAKAFPLIIEFLPEIENIQLVENDNKLTLEVEGENRDSMVEKIWRLKKILETVD